MIWYLKMSNIKYGSLNIIMIKKMLIIKTAFRLIMMNDKRHQDNYDTYDDINVNNIYIYEDISKMANNTTDDNDDDSNDNADDDDDDNNNDNVMLMMITMMKTTKITFTITSIIIIINIPIIISTE